MNDSSALKKQLKTVDFYGRDFLISSSVLTPRPETEALIDALKSLAGLPVLPGVKPPTRRLPKNPTILDVGTGSGILAITALLELQKTDPKTKVFASDISPSALKIAKLNCAQFNCTQSISFYPSDLLTDLPKTMKTPDLILANLPYVDKNWPWLDRPALEREDPPLALYSDDAGLHHIKTLITQLASPVPFLLLEADPSQHQDIINHAKNCGYTPLETYRPSETTFCLPLEYQE